MKRTMKTRSLLLKKLYSMIVILTIVQPRIRLLSSVQRFIQQPKKAHISELKVCSLWVSDDEWWLTSLSLSFSLPRSLPRFYRQISCLVAVLGHLRGSVHFMCHYLSIWKTTQQGRFRWKWHRSKSRAVSITLEIDRHHLQTHFIRFLFSFFSICREKLKTGK